MTLRPEILWQCDHPPPPALTKDEIAARLRGSLPDLCDRFMQMGLPAIGLWPQRRAEIPATASRFGGTPVAPPDWAWPAEEGEPLLFVGQINCAELRGLPGAEVLPSSGLLAFFGSEEAMMTHYPDPHSCVFHWRDTDTLVPAVSSAPPNEIFPQCALLLRPMFELPHPYSRAVEELGLSSERDLAYRDVWWEIHEHGIPKDSLGFVGFSKLLGWPSLIQNDLDRFQLRDDSRLLLQADQYCNGEQSHHWWRGGSLYYALSDRDLQARIYDRCELECQFT